MTLGPFLLGLEAVDTAARFRVPVIFGQTITLDSRNSREAEEIQAQLQAGQGAQFSLDVVELAIQVGVRAIQLARLMVSVDPRMVVAYLAAIEKVGDSYSRPRPELVRPPEGDPDAG